MPYQTEKKKHDFSEVEVTENEHVGLLHYPGNSHVSFFKKKMVLCNENYGMDS